MSSKPTVTELIALMNAKLAKDSCWSSFNDRFRYRRFLEENSKVGNFYTPSDVPQEPIPSDSTLGC